MESQGGAEKEPGHVPGRTADELRRGRGRARDGYRSSGRRRTSRAPQNLSTRSSNRQQRLQQEEEEERTPSQEQHQQQQRPSAKRAPRSRPGLLVRRNTVRTSKRQRNEPPPRNAPRRTSPALIQARMKSVETKIKREEGIAEAEGKSLIGRYTCRNVLYFVVAYGVVLCLGSAVDAYAEGMAHQPEQKYYFSHDSMDVLGGVRLVGLLASLTFVVFFARRSHKPLLIAVGVLVCSFGAMLWSAPYFADGSYAKSLLRCGDAPTLGFYYSEMCHFRNESRPNLITKTNSDVCSACVRNKDPWWKARETRFSLMCLGGFMTGVGTGLFASLGILYIEENTDRNTSPTYYGILMAMTGLGKFMGSCLVWWFNGYAEDLSVKPKLESWEIRAWWLGMVILSIFLLAIFWVFLLFPKWLTEPIWISDKRRRKIRYLNLYLIFLKNKMKQQKEARGSKGKGSQRFRQDRDANNPLRPPTYYLEDSTPKDQAGSALGNGNGAVNVSGLCEEVFREPKADNFQQVMTSTVEIDDPEERQLPPPAMQRRKQSARLGKHCSRLRDIFMVPGFTLVLLGVCLAAYFPAGYRTAIAEFVHHQYQLPAINSWFYSTGLSYSLAWCIGPAIGSLIIQRLRLTLRKQLVVLMLVLLLHMSFFFFLLPVSCQSRMTTSYNSSVKHCMDLCSCPWVQREAVCTPDGVMYSSPCHASCSINLTCNCTSSKVTRDNCASNCPAYGAYWILLFLATVCFSAGSVSVILMFLRTVDDDYKTMALSLAFWVVTVAAYVPGSAVYRAIAESSCNEYRENCLSERICSGFDGQTHRHFVTGSNIAFQAGAAVVFLVVFLLSSRRTIGFGREFNDGVRISYQESVEASESSWKIQGQQGSSSSGRRRRRRRRRRSGRSRNNSLRGRSNVAEGENQEEKLRKHLQLVEQQAGKRSSSAELLERSSSEADQLANGAPGRRKKELAPQDSSSTTNPLDGATPSNDSSTQRLIREAEALKQRGRTRPETSPPIGLPSERPLSNREVVEHYLSSIPDDFVYSRQVSMEYPREEEEREREGAPVNPLQVRLGLDNMAFDAGEGFIEGEDEPMEENRRHHHHHRQQQRKKDKPAPRDTVEYL